MDLLEALRLSRKEKDKKDSETNGGSPSTLTPTSTTTSATTATLTPTPPTSAAAPPTTQSSSLKGKFNFKLPLSSGFSNSSKDQTPASNNTATPGWIGDGTIPAVDYADLSKPPLLPRRPPPQTRTSADSVAQNAPAVGLESEPTRMHSTSSHKSNTNKSRSSSTERQHTPPMLSTLRNKEPKKQAANKKKSSPKRKEPATRPAASQAAGLAWDTIYRSPSSSDRTASDAALASSRLTTTSNETGFRKDPPESRSHSGDEFLHSRKRAPVEDPDDQIPRAHWREPADPAIRRVPVSSRGKPSGPDRNAAPPPPPPRRSSPKPTVRPKPDLLKSHQGHVRGTSTDADARTAKSGGWTLGTTSSSTPLARTRATPTSSGKVYRSSGNKEDKVLGAMNRLDVSSSSPRRQAKSRTPPSSDPESPAPQSTDAEDDGKDREAGNEKREKNEDGEKEEEEEDDAYKDVMNKLPRGVDAMAARQILNDIVVRGDEVHWDDIAGLEGAKKALKEAVVYPFLRPDLFSGLREPARGMLLFGPPGTGKTMLARAVATESKSTFFSVSASTLTSKWHGDSEKLVRALFGLAKALAPSIIFVDEIDSLLSARSSGTENEASRRSKTEFLIQWSDLQRAAAGREQGKDNKKIGDASRVLVLAATNMPWDIDEAARRRFVRRQYIPLPEQGVRGQQIRKLLSHQVYELSDEDIEVLVHVTEGVYPFFLCLSPSVPLTKTGFSGSDITALAKDAAMGPLRNLGEALLHTPMEQIRAIRFSDFEASLLAIRPSVSREGLRAYEEWAREFGERGG